MNTRLIFVPGFLGEPGDFEALQVMIQRRFSDRTLSCEVLDWMNWPKDATDLSLLEAGEFFGEALQSSQVSDVPGRLVFLGYSLGGRLSLSLRRWHQQKGREARFIFVSTNPGLSSEEEKSARRQQDRTWAERFRNENWISLLSDWNQQAVFKGSKSEPDRRALERQRAQLARVLENWSLAEQPDFREDLRGDDFCWLTGELDSKFCALAQGISHHQIIPSASHRVHLDAPGELAERVTQFLERTQRC